MSAFVTPVPLSRTALVSFSQLTHSRPTCLRHRHITRKIRANTPRASQANDDSVASWQEELRLLLDPSMPVGAKQVLLQDIAKRAPEILNDTVGSERCSQLGLDGVQDVIRQVQEDLVPDLLRNGPKYAANIAKGFPDIVTRMGKEAQELKMPMPEGLGLEDVQREFRNVFNKTPEGLFTPDYKVLGSYEGYEIRRYPDLIVAETDMGDAGVTEKPEMENVSAMGQSFNNLAGYLFGKNDRSQAMKMTTPVIVNKGETQESMSFIIGEYERAEDVPKALDGKVKLTEQPGKIFAALEFSGYVTQGEAKRQREKLLKLLEKDGIEVASEAGDSFKCMIYNGPSTLPNMRRNDLMIEVMYQVEEENASESV